VKLSSVIRWIALLLALVPALVGSGAAEPPRTPRVATLTSVGISSAATTNDASTLANYDPIAKIVTRQQTGPPPPWRRVSATPIYEPFRQEPTDSAGAIAAEGGSAGSGAIEPLWAQAPDNGFLGGWSTDESLQPGTVIDRYGGETGRFFSPEGTPFEERSLPAGSGPLNTYEVLKALDVRVGLAAPAFGEPGLGIQYMSSQTVADLIRAGFIKPVGP
jgi:hypothetical protein